MRIAWTGPVADGGGVPGMGKVMIEALLRAGVEVDVYLPLVGAEPPSFEPSPRLRTVAHRSWWRWGQWYSRAKTSAMFTSLVARSAATLRLNIRLLREHRRAPYDAVYQLSTTELFLLGRLRRFAPPIVVHPCTHAAGELRWHRREQEYALQSERRSVHLLVRGLLKFRARLQPSELARADLVLGLSDRFNQLIHEDYGVPWEKLGVVRTPVDLERFAPETPPEPSPKRTLLYVSRISTRKGLEEIIQLSHRLGDLADSVRLLVIGGPTGWSDYRRHLRRLNPAVAEYGGGVPSDELPALLRSATMLIVPSLYEPGSITTAEALACGLPVVLSDEVGAGEVVDGPHVRFHRAGDASALETAVRSLLERVARDEPALRATARANAERAFGPEIVVTGLIDAIGSRAGRRRVAGAGALPPAPSVTICIPTRGRPDSLAGALASMANSTYPIAQIVVSDDLHDPATEQVCKNAAVAVDYVLGPGRGVGANRNRAVEASIGDLILFVDDDCVLSPVFLEKALERMRDAERRYSAGRVIVSGRVLECGRVLACGDQTFLGFQSRPYASGEGLRSIMMPATLFPARTFHDVAFDPRLVYGYEEVDLAIRAVAKGYTIVDCADAVVEHVPTHIDLAGKLSYSEASRLHVTLRRYLVTERKPLHAAAFAIAAPVHHVAANVKRSGLSGIGTAARTFAVAASMARQSH